MKRILYTTLVVLLFSFATGFLPAKEAIADFALKDVSGRLISTKDYKDAKGFIIVFTCNHCPFAKLYTKRLNDLHQQFSKRKVPLLAINSMDTLLYEEEGFEMMKRKSKEAHFNFPYLQDATQAIGKQFDAKHTPMAYILWKEGDRWTIKYKGAIDDNGEHPEKATSYVTKALNELLQHKAVSLCNTESFGCRIIYRK